MTRLLTFQGAPTGTTKLGDWLEDDREGLRREYMSELRRNFRRRESRWRDCPAPVFPIGDYKGCAPTKV